MRQMAALDVQKQSPSVRASAGGILRCESYWLRRKKPILHRSAVGSAPETVAPALNELLRSSEAPDAAALAFMEPRLGRDFSQIPAQSKPLSSLQAKLTVNTPGDVFELEADRVADQVLATPAHPCVACAPLQIRRFSGQSSGQSMVAPTSVERGLASPGRPLEPALQRDMEERFGYDFSSVRVHTGSTAERSAREISAHAYTVGQDMVFGSGRFAPGTDEGRRLIAHELTHVVQQSESKGIRFGQNNEKRDLSLNLTTRRIQRNGDGGADPVVEIDRIGDIWHLTIRGFTEAGAVGGYIWPSGIPPGVRIVPLIVVEKPAQIGLFELTGVTLAALKKMNSPFDSWFIAEGIDWTPDDLLKMLGACDGGLAIWARARAANKSKDPKITPGSSTDTDLVTGEIRLESTMDKCHAIQSLIHELSNLSSLADINKIVDSAIAGDLSRDDYIKRMEKIEYEIGVKNVLTAFNACKDKWLCETSIMEYAAKARDFEDYFINLLKSSHKEGYGKQWDERFKEAFIRKHQ
jgi:hypothetical protein